MGLSNLVYNAGIIGGGFLIDRFFNTPTSTPNLPTISTPSSSGAVSIPTGRSVSIPTSRSVSNSRSKIDDVVDIASGFLGRSNNNVENVVNNYNTTNSNITNNYNNQQQSTNVIKQMPEANLLEVFNKSGAGLLAVKNSIDDLVAGVSGIAPAIASNTVSLSSQISDLTTSVYIVAGSIYETVGALVPLYEASFENSSRIISALESIGSSISNLGNSLSMPAFREFCETSTAVNRYKTTPRSMSDFLGNDSFEISPLEASMRKDISVGIAHALENSTDVSHLGLDDILDDYESALREVSKMFTFNGIADNLAEIASHISNGDINGYTPDVNLKG